MGGPQAHVNSLLSVKRIVLRVTGVIAFHEKAGLESRGLFWFFVGQGFSLASAGTLTADTNSDSSTGCSTLPDSEEPAQTGAALNPR
jgi:hypothetical protein